MRDKTLSKIVDHCIADNSIYLLLGDLGVFQASKGIEQRPLQVLNYGIRESSMVSFATGLSVAGSYPFLYSINPFLVERALEQLKDGPYYQETGLCLVTAGGSCDYSKLGYTHFCHNDVNYLMSVGISNIFLPFNAVESERFVDSSLDTRAFTCIRLSNEECYPQHCLDGHESLVVFVGPDSLHLSDPPQDVDTYYMNEISYSSLNELISTMINYRRVSIVCGFNASSLSFEILNRLCRLEISDVQFKIIHVPAISTRVCDSKISILRESCVETIFKC